MKLCATVIAATLLLAATELAQAAGTIASPAIYGGSSETIAYCALHNVGRTPRSAVLKIFDESGNTLSPSSQGCNGQYQPPGSSCVIVSGGMFYIAANIPAGVAYACSATGSVKKLRGSLLLGHDIPPSYTYRSAELR